MSEAIEIGYGNVFERTVESHESGTEVIIHKGGTGSGKTEDIIIFLLFYVALRQSNKIITVVSESVPHLEIGAIRILKKHLTKAGLYSEGCYNNSRSVYTSPTGSIIEFFSADRIGKALGARRDWLYGNEVNNIKLDVWEELARRSKYIIADFNPTHEFWLENWLLDYGRTEVILSNYAGNPFLPDHEVRRIEAKAKRDPNFRRVHIDCEYGLSEGVVFTNWHTGEFDNTLQLQGYGQDFGFAVDPTTLVHVGVDKRNKKLYADECYALPGLTTGQIAELNKRHAGTDVIVADSAESRLIYELRKDHRLNIRESEKGAGSITAGVTSMQDYELIVTPRSINLIKELHNYVYLDKGSKVYIDDYNHCIDGMRYIFMFLTSKSTSAQIWRA